MQTLCHTADCIASKTQGKAGVVALRGELASQAETLARLALLVFLRARAVLACRRTTKSSSCGRRWRSATLRCSAERRRRRVPRYRVSHLPHTEAVGNRHSNDLSLSSPSSAGLMVTWPTAHRLLLQRYVWA